MPDYEVIVSNIGTVYEGTHGTVARAAFREYVHASKKKRGRAANEQVVMLEDGEPVKEYLPPDPDVVVKVKGGWIVMLDGVRYRMNRFGEAWLEDVPEEDKMASNQRSIAMVVAIAPDAIMWKDNTGKPLEGVDQVKPGDFVMYAKSDESEININGEEFVMVSHFGVHGKIPSDPKFLEKFMGTSDPWMYLRKDMVSKESMKLNMPEKK